MLRLSRLFPSVLTNFLCGGSLSARGRQAGGRREGGREGELEINQSTEICARSEHGSPEHGTPEHGPIRGAISAEVSANFTRLPDAKESRGRNLSAWEKPEPEPAKATRVPVQRRRVSCCEVLQTITCWGKERIRQPGAHERRQIPPTSRCPVPEFI